MQLKLKGRHDAKVSAAPTDRPEQLGVTAGGCGDNFALCRNNLSRYQIVDCHAELPRGPAEATAKGHAAWTDWPWKLHRINGKKFELYNLIEDPMESKDLSGDASQQKRVEEMQKQLDQWMRSVVRSVNGADYQKK